MSRYSVKKPLTIIVLMMAVVLLAVISFTNMSTDLLPEMDLPYVVVMTTYPGATPEKVEATVTKPLEQGLATTSGLANITSVSQENVSMVIMEFNQGTNMDSVMIELSGSIDLVEGYFDDAVGTPTMMKLNPDMMAVLVASADIEGMDFKDACDVITEKVIPALERVDGVASVTGSGLLEETVQVVVSQDKIDALNKKILRAVDDELAEAQEKLEEAQEKIYDGHNAINRQQKELETQKEQLVGGIEQLNAGLEQAKSGLAALMEQRTTVVEGIAKLEETLPTLEQQEAALAAYEQMLSEEEKLTLAALRTNIAELKGQLETAKAGLAQIDTQKAQLEGTIAQLEGQLTEAKSGLNMIENEAPKQLSNARAQLNAGQKELDAQRDKFEDARDEALEKADISGLITADMITGILTAQNFAMPAGYLVEENTQIAVKVGEAYADVDELKNQLLFTIPTGNIGYVYLEDVAEVMIADNSEELYAKINGNDGVLLSFQKQSTAATTDVTHDLNDAMAELEQEIPGLRMSVLQDQGVYIDTIISAVLENLIMGGTLAVIVLWIFLRSFRPTLIVALSIPLSLMLAVVLMYFSGVTLNIISLAGLMLGVGMLVDNSIVVIENIYRLRALGVPAAKAAVKGAGQVGGAIMSSTLTTVCVFLPIVFTEGLTRQIFTDMGLTIAYSLMASLLIAMTLVPALASTMLRNVKDREHKLFNRFAHGYGTMLQWTLRHKAIALLLAVALLGIAAGLALNMGTAFMPEADSPQVSASLTMPEDATREETREMSAEIIERIMTIPEVETVGAMEGGTALLSGGDGITYYLILREDRTISSQEVARILAEKTADLDCTLDISASTMDLSMLGGSGVSVVIEGNDLDKLREIAGDMTALLKETEGTTQIDDGMEEADTELRVVVDKNKAMNQGLTVAQVYQQVAAAISEEATATNLTLENQSVPVVVMQDSGLDRTNLMAHTWEVTGKDGTSKTVRLSDVAEITEAPGFTAITHNNQTRTLTVSAQIADGYNVGLVSREFEEKLDDYETPSGYNIYLDGENEMINKTLMDLLTMIGVSVILIYLIMVAQFQNWLSPFIVIFTIPLAFTGGLLALWLAKMELSMIAMLGFLMLSGVIVNNGIVFVDYANQLRAEGMEKRDALIETGRTRLRPILMTTMTTVLGLITMAMGMGSGAEMLQPMAVVMIGGLMYATLMTLFVVPALYDLFQRKPLVKVDLEDI